MKENRSKYRIFYKLEEHMEIPMFLLAILWLYLFIVELVSGLNETQEDLIYVIWILFIVEFLIKLLLAPRKIQFLRNNWITIIALAIPVLRTFRIFYAISLLRSVRVVNSTNIIRALTSGKRFFIALKEAQGPRPTPEMNIGILIASGRAEKKEDMLAHAKQLIDDVKPELEKSTLISWNFDITDTTTLESDETKRPSDFLDSASLRMAEGPYDLITVLTDVPLMSRKNRIEAGLVSSVARIITISTRKLTTTGKNKPQLKLSDQKVKLNSAWLFLHLMGHVMGLEQRSSSQSRIMKVRDFDYKLNEVPTYNSAERQLLRKKVENLPDRELRGGNFLETFIFHLLMTLRHPKEFFRPLLRNAAFFLPLSLPSLATAAVAPGLIFVFTAEIWDVGFGMTNSTAIFFAIVSILLASFYLVRVQSLFLPRKEKRVLTEHLAVANSVIYFSIFFACIGLFVMVGVLMMVVELYVFPAGLMQTWPTLEQPAITFTDKVRLAVFISTVGVTTGALAGGLESRAVIQHLALFRKRV